MAGSEDEDENDVKVGEEEEGEEEQAVEFAEKILLHKLHQALLLSNAYRNTALMNDDALGVRAAYTKGLNPEKKSLIEIVFGKESGVRFNKGSQALDNEAQQLEWLALGYFTIFEKDVHFNEDRNDYDEQNEDRETAAAKQLCQFLYGTDDINKIIQYHTYLLFLQGRAYKKDEFLTALNKSLVCSLPRLYSAQINVNDGLYNTFTALQETQGDLSALQELVPTPNSQSVYSLLYSIKNVNTVERWCGKNQNSRLADMLMHIMGVDKADVHENDFYSVVNSAQPTDKVESWDKFKTDVTALIQKIRTIMIGTLFRYFTEYSVEIAKRSEAVLFRIHTAKPKQEADVGLTEAENTLNSLNNEKDVETEFTIDDRIKDSQSGSTLELVAKKIQTALQPVTKLCQNGYEPMSSGLFAKKLEDHKRAFGQVARAAQLNNADDLVESQTRYDSAAPQA